MKTTKCDKKECDFYEEGTGCPTCKECQAQPNLINDYCETCWGCKKDEGFLRNNPELPEGLMEIIISPEFFEDNEQTEVITNELTR